MNQDREHLKILSIFHYVVAGLGALFGCFPIFHLAMGIMMLIAGIAGEPGFESGPPPLLFGLMFTAIPLVMILLGWGFAICMFLAGRYLTRYQRHTFCLVMAGIGCAFMPFGTVLGVFTILVLMRPSVRELFGVETEPVESPV